MQKPICKDGETLVRVPINKTSNRLHNRCCSSWVCKDNLPCMLRMGDLLFKFGIYTLAPAADPYIRQLLCIFSNDNEVDKDITNNKVDDVCPIDLCLSNGSTCVRDGGSIVQLSPPDPLAEDKLLRCCGNQTCSYNNTYYNPINNERNNNTYDIKYALEGHTDSKGSEAFNERLGLQRSISVYNRLREIAMQENLWNSNLEHLIEPPICDICVQEEVIPVTQIVTTTATRQPDVPTTSVAPIEDPCKEYTAKNKCVDKSSIKCKQDESKITIDKNRIKHNNFFFFMVV
jgi:hypothetical protein